MRTYKTAMATSLLFISITPFSSVFADDYYCPPDFGAETVDGNILIAAPCNLTGTTVKGNVLLYAGGSLTAIDVYIEGNIQADMADFVRLENSDVAGSMTGVIGDIQLDKLVGDLSYIRDSSIKGSIQLNANRSRLEVERNYVNGDVQAFDNTGGVLIQDNVIDGNLQCKSNDPGPVGGGNQVAGNKEDQCEYLSPESSGDEGTTGTTTGSATAPSSSADASSAGSSGGGAAGPLFSLLLSAVALLRLRERRRAFAA